MCRAMAQKHPNKTNNMTIYKNHPLKKHNTLAVEAKCSYYCEVKSAKELAQLLQNEKFKKCKKHLILGGGSNLLLATNKYTGFVIKNKIKGIEKINETKNKVYYSFGAGESWDKIVYFTAQKNLGGIENLAYIPGTVGGAVVQNIAAYDQNLQDTFYSLIAINKNTLKTKTFYKPDCKFKYRESFFKTTRNPWIVTNVTLALNKNAKLDLKYFEMGLNKTSLQTELEQIAKPPYSVIDMYKAVASLRQKRIPSEKQFPNPGSFFKNPVITKQKYLRIKEEILDLQFYPAGKVKYVDNTKITSTKVKISYGQLFDLGLNLRGFKKGNVGIHPNIASFIYSNGKASGQEILQFSKQLKQQMYEKYKIELEEEVRIIN